jgi:hypothetical protein
MGNTRAFGQKCCPLPSLLHIGINLAQKCQHLLFCNITKKIYNVFKLMNSGEIPWNALCFSAALGLGFNFFLNFGVAYTYPLYMSVGQALVAPLNLLVDLIWREEEFSTYQIIGSCLSIAAFSTLLIPLKQKENIEDEDKNETTL